MYFLELTKMTEFMKKTIKRKKYLFWYDSDEKTEIEEFRVCDCFQDPVLNFKNELNIVGEFCDNLKELFFDQIPIIPDIDDDVFLLFGKISIVCCRSALFQFDYRKFILDDKMYNNCLAYFIDCNCMYYLEKKLSYFDLICSNCQYNLVKMVSNRFIKIEK